MDCTRSAYKHCSALYDLTYSKLRADDFRGILGQLNSNGKPLSHALQEHIKNLFTQMDKYALQNDIIEKGYASYASITVAEDDTPGVPFTVEELQILWNNKGVPWVDSILIYIYLGWRISELILMPTENIDLAERTFKGGLKTAAGNQPITTAAYTSLFKKTLKSIGILTYHTPHDCRHTFTSLLDSAGVNQVCIDRLIGHASGSLTTRTYTHKSIEELRQAIEMI